MWQAGIRREMQSDAHISDLESCIGIQLITVNRNSNQWSEVGLLIQHTEFLTLLKLSTTQYRSYYS